MTWALWGVQCEGRAYPSLPGRKSSPQPLTLVPFFSFSQRSGFVGRVTDNNYWPIFLNWM